MADVAVEPAIDVPTHIELFFCVTKLVSSCLDHVNVRLDPSVYTVFVVEQKMWDLFLIAVVLSLLPTLCDKAPSTPIDWK